MSTFVYKGGGRGQKRAKICLRGLWMTPYEEGHGQKEDQRLARLCNTSNAIEQTSLSNPAPILWSKNFRLPRDFQEKLI